MPPARRAQQRASGGPPREAPRGLFRQGGRCGAREGPGPCQLGGGHPLLSSRSGRGTHRAQAPRALPAPPPANIWARGRPVAQGWTEGSGPQGPGPSPRGPRPPRGQGGPQVPRMTPTGAGLGGARWAPGRQRRGLDLSPGRPRCPSDLQNKPLSGKLSGMTNTITGAHVFEAPSVVWKLSQERVLAPCCPDGLGTRHRGPMVPLP